MRDVTVVYLDRICALLANIGLLLIHRFTYPKGVHSYRFFLQPIYVHQTLCHLFMHINQLQFSGKMHIIICMSRLHKNLRGGHEYLYECTPFGYVNLCIVVTGFWSGAQYNQWWTNPAMFKSKSSSNFKSKSKPGSVHYYWALFIIHSENIPILPEAFLTFASQSYGPCHASHTWSQLSTTKFTP